MGGVELLGEPGGWERGGDSGNDVVVEFGVRPGAGPDDLSVLSGGFEDDAEGSDLGFPAPAGQVC